MINSVKDYILSLGYNQIDINLDNTWVYMCIDNKKCKVCVVGDYISGLEYNEQNIDKINNKIIDSFKKEGYSDISCCNIYFVDDYIKRGITDNVEICINVNNNMCYLVDGLNLRSVFEKEICGIRNIIEYVDKEDIVYSDVSSNNEILQYLSFATVKIAIANIAVFVILRIVLLVDIDLYMNILERGANGYEYVMQELQLYRLFTCMFLHSDTEHLINNMLSLIVLGVTLEKIIGKKKLLFIYFSTGIIAGCTSISYNMLMGNSNVLSLGASGAVFGLTGLMITILLFNKNLFGQIGTHRFIIYSLLSLYAGFTSDNIDNAAHVGGLIGGIIVSILLLYSVPRDKKVCK